MNDPDPIEGEYIDPAQPAPKEEHRKKGRGVGTIAATLAVLAAKFKAILAFVLQFKFALFGLKALSVSWTFLLSLWVYALVFGWKLGIVVLLVLAAHELGHYFAYRAYGLQARLPVFIPLLGAYTQGALATDLEQDAYIALAGPLTGLALAGACFGAGLATGDPFWYACADIGAFINLFNMLPVPPFDGGRVIGAVWPALWIAGIALFVVAAAFLHVPVFLVLLIAIFGVPTIVATYRGGGDPRAATMTTAAKVRVGAWYIATIIGLIALLGQAHSALPQSGGLL